MRITYDPEVDAMSIVFRETTVTTKHLGEGIAADVDCTTLSERLLAISIIAPPRAARADAPRSGRSLL